MTSLWCVRWTRPLTMEEETYLKALLPPHRRERLERTKDRRKRDQVLCAYGLLHLAAGGGTMPLIAVEAGGKPYFAERPGLHFSLSHTEGAVMIGLSDHPIGVDIEKIRPLGPRIRQKLGEELTDKEIFQRWTALEACAKRTGKGVGEFLHGDFKEPASCCPIQVGEGYCASVDCEGAVTVHHCTLEDVL